MFTNTYNVDGTVIEDVDGNADDSVVKRTASAHVTVKDSPGALFHVLNTFGVNVHLCIFLIVFVSAE